MVNEVIMEDLSKHVVVGKFLYEGLSLGIIVLNEKYEIVLWNKWMQFHTGIKEADIAYKNIFEMFPSIKIRGKDQYIRNCIKNQEPYILSPYFHEYLIPIDIKWRAENVRMLQKTLILPTGTDDVNFGVVIIIEDHTEAIFHEQEISRLNRILKGIRSVDSLITHTTTEQELLRGICKIMVEEIGYALCWIGFKQKENFEVLPVAHYGLDDELFSKIKVTWDESEYGLGVAGMGIKTGKIQTINWIEQDPKSKPWIEITQKAGLQAACAVPLIVENDVIGIMCVDSKEKNVFYEEEQKLLQEVASDISFAIQSLREKEKRQRAEQALRHTAKQWRTSFDAISDCVLILDADGYILQCNKAVVKLTNKSFQELIGKKYWDAVHHSSEPIKNCPFIKMKRTLQHESSEIQFNDRWLQLTSDPVFDDEGHLLGAVQLIKDITERKLTENQIRKSLAEKEILLKEIHHRVKNNLQVIVSLLKLQSKKIEDPFAQDAFKESINRIYSMALIHEQLYRSQDFSKIKIKGYIQSMVEKSYYAYNVEQRIKLKLNLQETEVGLDKAIPFGLILNELVTNAFKHAFPQGRKGSLFIKLYSPKKHVCCCVVQDNGIGIPESINIEKTDSLGLRLVKILSDQIDASIHIIREKGTRFKLEFSI